MTYSDFTEAMSDRSTAYAQRATADRLPASVGATTERSVREVTERPDRADWGTGGGFFKDFLLAEKDKDKNAAGGGDKFAPKKNKPDGDFSPSGTKKIVRFTTNSWSQVQPV